MKICFFMNTPFNLGGEQRIVTVLANYLVDNGYDVYFLLTNSNHVIDRKIYNMDKRIKIIFVEEYNRKILKLKRKIISKISQLNSYTGIFKEKLMLQKKFYCIDEETPIFDKYIKNYNFDYIIGIGNYYSGKLCILKEKLNFSAKTIAWEHNCFNSYFKTKGLRFYNQKKFVKYLLKNIDKYVVQTSDDVEKFIKEFSYTPIKINNSNTFEEYHINNLKNKHFIAAGRFSDVKNFPFLIEAFNIFHKNNKEWKLYIYGIGKQYKEVKKIVKTLNLEEYVFLPGKTSNISEKYLESSIFILPSKWEGWGMVVTEAMQFGLPIISSNIPSTIEIFGDAECGIIVKKLEPELFAKAMNEMVDRDYYKSLSKNCLERVKKFDIKIIGEKWKKILD